MRIRHLILALIRQSGDCVEGKTNLQKEMYFISIILGMDLGFKPHFYGPYSPEVEQGLGELIGAGFVDMKWNSYGVDSESGFEMKKYTYTLTESGKRLSDILAGESPEYDIKKIKSFVDKLKEMGSPNYQSLSLAAKAYFILKKEGEAMNKKQLKENMLAFGWKVPDEDIESAVGLLSELGFIKENQ
jgi:uncharacterized protein YwgA